MKEEKVITVSGREEPREKCRKIRGEYYLIGDVSKKDSGDCYKINNRYYKSHTGYIVYDHRLNQYVVKKMNVIIDKGVVGLDKDENLQFGSFSIDMDAPAPPVVVDTDGRQYNVLSADILAKSFRWQEDLRTGEFVDRRSIQAVHLIQPAKISQDMKRNLPYDSTGRTEHVEAMYNKLFKPKYSETIDKFSYAMDGLSFGVEFETVKGFIPQRVCDPLGLMALRDGSIQGLEYVTIPLSGKKGMQALVDSLGELSRRTEYDESCALHIHIGGMPRTEEFMLAFMRILYLIQDEMFSFFPLYKKENYGVKRKHYTKPYCYKDTLYHLDRVIDDSNIKRNFGELYRFLSMGQDYRNVGNEINNVTCHPSDPHGTSKWNIKTRYYWVNMIPLLFGNKKTVEFRIHTPTYDSFKIMNYLVLCGAIVKYTMKNTHYILTKPERYQGIGIDNILASLYYDEPSGSLLVDGIVEYFNRRRSFFHNCVKHGNIKGNEEDIQYTEFFDWAGNLERFKKGRAKVRGNDGIRRALEQIEMDARARQRQGQIGRPVFDRVLENAIAAEEPQVVRLNEMGEVEVDAPDF